jgi:hypothetical protein
VAQIVAKRNLRSARSADAGELGSPLEFVLSGSEAGPRRGEPARGVIVRQAIAAASPVALRKALRAAPRGAATGD